MADIQSVTLSYAAVEDRVELALKIRDGDAVRLWLTQRLARMLVGALAGHLEKVEDIPLPSVRDSLMAQEQVEAVSALRPAPAVQVRPDDNGHLITDIAVRLAADRIGLAFTSDLDIKPGIMLNGTLARQWLGLLHRQFALAGWPQDVWPVWMQESAPAAMAQTTRH